MKNKFILCSFLLIIALAFNSCKQTNNDTNDVSKNYFSSSETGIKTGGVKIVEIISAGKKFKVWTKRIGNNPKIKLLLLNGGPGATHEYFECMESFLPAEGIEFIYYDQLGCGNSDNPDDTSMWDLSRYVEEVEQVRMALNLAPDNFYLLGHSWGGILAMQYALKYQQHIRGLIISNMMSSGPEYGKYADDVLSLQMDPAILTEIRDLENKKDFSNPRFMKLLYEHYYTAHILRQPLDSWPEPVTRSFAKINQSLYVTMQGPSEFGISGKLENWDVKSELKNITVPVLVIGARHDTMDPAHMEWMSKEVKNGTYLFCPNGSHMCMYDDQEIYMRGLINFLKTNNQK